MMLLMFMLQILYLLLHTAKPALFILGMYVEMADGWDEEKTKKSLPTSGKFLRHEY